MSGLKNVRNRRDDALSRVRWDQFESLLAVYFRGQGYEVDHCGTGGGDTRFDGGIDLRLRRPGEYVLVHVGFALSKLDEAEARRVFELLLELGQLEELGPAEPPVPEGYQ